MNLILCQCLLPSLGVSYEVTLCGNSSCIPLRPDLFPVTNLLLLAENSVCIQILAGIGLLFLELFEALHVKNQNMSNIYSSGASTHTFGASCYCQKLAKTWLPRYNPTIRDFKTVLLHSRFLIPQILD